MEQKFRKRIKTNKEQSDTKVLSILGKQVRDNSGSCLYRRPKRRKSLCPTLGASRRLGVYLLLAHGTGRQSHHKVVYRPTPKSTNGIPNGASFDTAVTIESRFALLNVKRFSDLSPLFQHAQSFALMSCQSISWCIDWSWRCSAMADLELCPSL